MDNTYMGGQKTDAEATQPTSFLPRNYSLLIITAIIGLALLAAAETKLGLISHAAVDYSRWPDDFLNACGELRRARLSIARSPLVTATVIAGCGMLILLLCENYWDRLRSAWQQSPLGGFLPAGQARLLDEIDDGFGRLLLGLTVALVALDVGILLLGIPQLQVLQPLALTRYVAIPIWLLREWLPGQLRGELEAVQ